MGNTNVKFVTVAELANKICNCDFGVHIGFTLNSLEEINDGIEPTGWYGITMSELFNGESCVIGYYGGGIVMAYNTCREKENTIDFIIDFLKSEGYKNPNINTLICVDKKEFDDASDRRDMYEKICI